MVCGRSKTQIYLTLILKTNPYDISVPCIKIARSAVLFEIYTMALNWDKYDIEV